MTTLDEPSAWEIERWTGVLARDTKNGRERLRRYVCSLTLGRDFNESGEAYFQRRGFTHFIEWARVQP